MAKVGGQRQHMFGAGITAIRAGLQGSDREGVPQGADDRMGFPRGERQGGGKVSETRVERGAIGSYGVPARGSNGPYCGPREHPVLQTRLAIPLGGGQGYPLGRRKVDNGNSG
jgi:hypothetical protein